MFYLVSSVVAILVVALRRRPKWMLSLVMAAFVLLPGPARGVYLRFLHPAAWLVILVLAVILFTNSRFLRRAFARSRIIASVAALLVAYASIDLLLGVENSILGFLSTILALVVVPMLLLIITRQAVAEDESAGLHLARTALLLGIVETVVAYFQYTTKSVIFYQNLYESQWWWGSGDNVSRVMATTGHPIQLAILMSMLVPLTVFVKNILIRYGLIIAFVGTIMWSGARSGLILAVIGVLFVFISEKRRVILNLVFGGIAAVAVWFSFQSQAGQDLLLRFVNDGGSTQTRLAALQWAGTYWRSFAVTGYPGARDLRSSGDIRSSLENGFLMAGVNYGLVWSGILILLIIGVFLTAFKFSRPVAAWSFAALAGVLGFTLSSSFMGFSLEGSMVWFFFGVALGMRDQWMQWTSKAPRRSAGNVSSARVSGRNAQVSEKGQTGSSAIKRPGFLPDRQSTS